MAEHRGYTLGRKVRVTVTVRALKQTAGQRCSNIPDILPQILGSQRLEKILGRRAPTTSWDLELV